MPLPLQSTAPSPPMPAGTATTSLVLCRWSSLESLRLLTLLLSGNLDGAASKSGLRLHPPPFLPCLPPQLHPTPTTPGLQHHPALCCPLHPAAPTAAPRLTSESTRGACWLPSALARTPWPTSTPALTAAPIHSPRWRQCPRFLLLRLLLRLLHLPLLTHHYIFLLLLLLCRRQPDSHVGR